MLFIEILLSIHCLLFVSSWIICGRFLRNQPSLKLKLARLLLVSCVLSPILVHCISPTQKPEHHQYVSFDTLQEYVSKPVFKVEQSSMAISTARLTMSKVNYIQLFFMLVGLLMISRCYRLLQSLRGVQSILADAIPYRTSGKLVIKMSSRCHIPFSVYFFNKAYIIVPVSLCSSAQNVALAIAHEGQHHRNGDCLWAYFLEILRIVFLGNPGVNRWSVVLSELQECSCDEVLVGQPKISAHDYGHCLLDVVKTVSQDPLPAHAGLACTVGMALGNQKQKECIFLIRRISMLSVYSQTPAKHALLGIACAGLVVLAPIGVAYSALGSLTKAPLKAVDTSHLDPKLQSVAENEINAAVKRYHAQSGVITIADPTTGNIIAFAETSSNKGGDSWKTRVFSPGSTIKPFIAAAAIDAGKSSETKTYDCHSPYLINRTEFTNYNPNVNSASLTEAIAKSINVCLIKVSQETGAPIIRQKLTEFGFDMTSWWQANQSDELQLAKAALGENIPVTMESLTKSYAILANQGHSFDKAGAPVIAQSTTHSINHMLEQTVINGTGKRAAISKIAVAGKTGTVLESKEKQLALFAGYVPADKPQYVMLVVIEGGSVNKNGQHLNSGGELAAPVFRTVALRSLDGKK
jgi:beta-lactamase regulating signal transducer with metallopeptidase domain